MAVIQGSPGPRPSRRGETLQAPGHLAGGKFGGDPASSSAERELLGRAQRRRLCTFTLPIRGVRAQTDAGFFVEHVFHAAAPRGGLLRLTQENALTSARVSSAC